MADWLALAGVRMALAPLCILAGALDKAGFRMPVAMPEEPVKAAPRRSVDFTSVRAVAPVDRGATLVH
ncbi:hypothetical protein ACIU1J_30830 [Azospirillum doebereinerae]